VLRLENIPGAAQVKALVKRVTRYLPAATLPPGSFYRPSADCQVRGLDAIYNAAFGGLKRGTFVEIGAYDGQFASNTSFLADLGWRGVYVEPIPEFAAACAKRHRGNPGVTIVNAAVGRAAGSAELYVAGTLTTTNNSLFSAYRNIPWAKGVLSDRKVTAPVMTLDQLLENYRIPNCFELLVVDVEGAEPDVFAGFDLARWNPEMLIVELGDYHPDFVGIEGIQKPAAELRKRVLQAGYTEVYVDSINTVFRAKMPRRTST
jgi:FkbM family methyltransferase